MKNVKGLDYLLAFGMFILFFAGMSLMENDIFEYALIRCSGMLLISFIFYILSILFSKLLNVDTSGKVAYGLGCLSLVITFITSGGNNLFGSWYSLNGGGVDIFLASIAIIIGILAVLTVVLYKNYNFIHLAFVSIIFMVICLLNFYKVNYQIIFIIISSVLLIINLFKFNKRLYEFSNVAIFISSIIGLSSINGDAYLLSLILFSLNLVSILKVLGVEKGLEYELLSVLTLYLVIIGFAVVTNAHLSNSVSLILSISVICVIDLIIATFRLLTNKFVKIAYKVMNILSLFIVLVAFDFNTVAHLIGLIFILVTSLVTAFLIHNDDYEEYLLPFKAVFISFYLNNAVSFDIASMVFGVQAIVFALMIRKFNGSNFKPVYVAMTVISLFLMAVHIDESMLVNSISILTMLLSYLIVRGKNDSVSSNIVFIFSLIVMLINIEMFGFVEDLILIIVSGILAYVHRKNKVCFSGAILLLLLMIQEFLETTIANYSLYIILLSLMCFILIGVTSEVLFENSKSKNVFAGIMIVFAFLELEMGDDFLISIYALIVSLSIMLISIKNNGYKSLYYIGLVFGSLHLLGLLFSIEGIPAALYLIIISLILIIVVSIMIYRYQNKKVVEAEQVKKPVVQKKENNVRKVNFCSECGSRVNQGDVYCGECGHKVK